MFKARHDELLQHAFFSGPALPGTASELQTVEAWRYAGVDKCDETNFRHRTLKDRDVESWLAGKDEFAPPQPAGKSVLHGSVRILFCERVAYRPPGFGMSRQSFIAVEQKFNLPLNTLEAAFNNEGSFSKHYHYIYNGELEDKESISFVIKAPQKMPIANYLLALTYHIPTKTTTAFIHGAFLHTVLPMIDASLLQAPFAHDSSERHLSHRGFVPMVGTVENTQSASLIAHLRSVPQQWTNPLLLPALLLENHTARTFLFSIDLGDQIVALERTTGVVFAGRDVKTNELDIEGREIPKPSVKRLTQDMHTLHTQIIFFQTVVEWEFDCLGFLKICATELQELSSLKSERRNTREMIESIDLFSVHAKGMIGIQKSLKERVQSQIGVLYSFIAQIDNSINAKIAVSSARDSSAMKTLALITTIFLPGTYIATLFSMSMFEWTSSPSSALEPEDTQVVSDKFWIYWAITVPLTLIVLIMWRAWWLWQERSYQRDVKEAVEKVMDDEKPGNGDDATVPEKKTANPKTWRRGKKR